MPERGHRMPSLYFRPFLSDGSDVTCVKGTSKCNHTYVLIMSDPLLRGKMSRAL